MSDKLYIIVNKHTKEVLTPKSFKKYWPNYGNNSLCGWKPPKKVYYTLGTAKTGFNYIPEKIKKKDCEIAIFKFSESVVDGNQLLKESNQRRKEKDKREKEAKLNHKRQEIERLQKELEEAKKDVE